MQLVFFPKKPSDLLPPTIFDIAKKDAVYVISGVGVPEKLIKIMNQEGKRYERIPEMMTPDGIIVFFPKAWVTAKVTSGYFTCQHANRWVSLCVRVPSGEQGSGTLVQILTCEFSDDPLVRDQQIRELTNIRNAEGKATSIVAFDSRIEPYQDKRFVLPSPWLDAWDIAGTSSDAETRPGSRRDRVWIAGTDEVTSSIRYSLHRYDQRTAIKIEVAV